MSEVKKQTTAIPHGKCPVMHGGNTTVGTSSTMDWWPKALESRFPSLMAGPMTIFLRSLTEH